VGQEARRAIFLAALGSAAREEAFTLLNKLRKLGLAAQMDFADRSLKAQLSLADRLGAAYVIIMGDLEMAKGEALVRPMADFAYKSEDQMILAEAKAGQKFAEKQQHVPLKDLEKFLVSQILNKEGK